MAEQFVKSKLAPNKVTVFGKPGCPYCTKAVALLDELGLKPGHMEYVDLTARSDTNEIQKYFQQTTGAKTVPRVFIGEKCIGGYTDLESLYRSGELKSMLEKIGAL